MHILLCEEVSYEILDYESKFLQIITSTFLRFRWIKYIYVNKATLMILDTFY